MLPVGPRQVPTATSAFPASGLSPRPPELTQPKNKGTQTWEKDVEEGGSPQPSGLRVGEEKGMEGESCVFLSRSLED